MKIKKLTPGIYFTLLLICISELLTAQNKNLNPTIDSLAAIKLSEVVITANRYNSIRMNTSEAIEILDHKSILQYQLRTAPEVLQNTPGVFIQKTNHGGGSPFLRGLTGNQTLLLIDGIRLSNATMRYGPNQYFNTIDVFSLGKIEVLRGGGSVQYGSDAMGGTIQAFSNDLSFTKKKEWRSTLLSRFATQGMEQSLHANVNYSSEKVSFSTGLTWRNFGDLVGGDTTGKQKPTGYCELDYDIKGKVLLSPTTTLTMALQSVHQSDVPVYHKYILENYAVNKMDPQKRRLAYVQLNKTLNSGIWKSATITASLQNTEEGRESRKNVSAILRSEYDKVRSYSFSAETYTAKGRIWSANSGVEIYNDLVNSTRYDTDLSKNSGVSKRGLYPNGATMTSIAAFSLHTFDFPKWNFRAGARFSTFIINVEDDKLGKTTLTPSTLVGNIAILRKLDRTSSLFVSLNNGFRAPNIDDLGTLGIVDFRYETPNFNLKPEQSLQYQIGYKYNGTNLSGEIYFYRNELYNLIVRNRVGNDSIEGYPVYQKENVERAYIQGFETTWHYIMNASWMISGNMTYTYGQNITKKEPARRIPPLFGSISVEYSYQKWWCNLEWLSATKQSRLAKGDQEDNRIPIGGTPGWNIFNISSSYTIQFIKVDLRLQNLLNKDYRYHGSGVNGYGRSALLSLIVNI